jgi:hypothetical protein
MKFETVWKQQNINILLSIGMNREIYARKLSKSWD